MNKKIHATIGITLAVGFLCASRASAAPTPLTVRVRAHYAKFIGTGAGQVRVTVRDFTSRAVLASGYVSGGTGNTATLMTEKHGPGDQLSDKGSAAYRTTIDIEAPTKVLVEVEGPLSAGLNAHHESKTTWLLPGKGLGGGDGLVFEMYGLMVRNYHPLQHEFVAVGDTAAIGAHVTPMCGCPVSPGFLWDADTYTVTAAIYKNGAKVAEIPLSHAGRISDFEGKYTFEQGGTYQVVTTAMDTHDNIGVDTTSYVVVPAGKIKKMSGRSSR